MKISPTNKKFHAASLYEFQELLPRIWIFGLVIFSLSSSLSLQAQESEIDVFSLSLKELMSVKITGSTLTSESQKTVPAAVTVFNHNQIKIMGIDNLAELMNLVPGFQSYRSSSTSMHYPFSSRGRRIGVTSAEVLVLVDGQRLNEPRTGGITNLVPNFPLNSIEKIEFVRGSGAAVYGSNAMMGVINIVTRRDVNEVNLRYGSYNNRYVDILTNQKISGVSLDLFARVEKNDGDTYRVQDTFSPAQITTQDPFGSLDLNFKLAWRQTMLTIQHSRTEADDFYNVNRLSNGVNEFNSELNFITLKQGVNWASVESWLWFSYSSNNVNQSAQITAVGELEGVSFPSSASPLYIRTDFNDSEYRLQWHNDWSVSDNSSLQFGVEYRHVDVPDNFTQNNFDLASLAYEDYPIPYYGQAYAETQIQLASKRHVTGVYSQYQSALFNSSHLTLGVRYDEFSGIGSQISPRFGWVQEIGEHQSIKLLYGEAFRAPSENELYLINNPVFLGNPDLKPETVKSLDLIWFGAWPKIGASLGYFQNHFEGAIAQTLVGDTIQYTNIANVEDATGYELELSYELNKQFLLRSSYTYISDNSALSFREADQLASLTLDYQNSMWRASLVGSYHDDRNTLTDNGDLLTLNSYWQFYGSISYLFSKNLEAYVKIKNISDAHYSAPSDFPIGTEGVVGRGREVKLGLVARW